MPKSPDAFRTISEVSELLDVPAHVLRFWESKFAQVKPVKRAGGRRYYRPSDIALLGGIKTLLYDDGLTIRGVQKRLRDSGVKAVAALGEHFVALEGDEIDMEPAASETRQKPEHEAWPAEPTALEPKAADTPVPSEDTGTHGTEDEITAPTEERPLEWPEVAETPEADEPSESQSVEEDTLLAAAGAEGLGLSDDLSSASEDVEEAPAPADASAGQEGAEPADEGEAARGPAYPATPDLTEVLAEDGNAPAADSPFAPGTDDTGPALAEEETARLTEAERMDLETALRPEDGDFPELVETPVPADVVPDEPSAAEEADEVEPAEDAIADMDAVPEAAAEPVDAGVTDTAETPREADAPAPEEAWDAAAPAEEPAEAGLAPTPLGLDIPDDPPDTVSPTGDVPPGVACRLRELNSLPEGIDRMRLIVLGARLSELRARHDDDAAT